MPPYLFDDDGTCGAVGVVVFAEGRQTSGPPGELPRKELPQHLPGIDARVAAIYRRGRPIIPEGDSVIEAEDEDQVARHRNGSLLGTTRRSRNRIKGGDCCSRNTQTPRNAEYSVRSAGTAA